MKYMVMECHPGYCVVLSEDGRFLKAANRRYTVGETVTDIIEMRDMAAEEKKLRISRMWRSLAVAACLLLVVGGMFFRFMPCAAVYVTINPEVRMDVNRADAVLRVDGINEDGMALVEGMDLSGMKLEEAMDTLLDRAVTMGYLQSGGKVTLTLDANDRWMASHKDQMEEQVRTHVKEDIVVVVDVLGKTATSVPNADTVKQDGQTTGPDNIPVVPTYGDSDYGITDYETGDGDTDYGPDNDGVTDYGTDDGDTDYGPDNDGTTDYNTDDGDTDYGPDGLTDYDERDPAETKP